MSLDEFLTPPKLERKPNMPDTTLIRVEFGNVSVGDSTARLGVKIPREAIPLQEADRIFCGKRLWGTVSLGEPGDADQSRLPTMEDNVPLSIEDAFDTKQLSVKPNEYSVGLTFNIKSIDIAELCQFAKKSGSVSIVSVKELDHEDSVDDEGWEHEMDREEGEGDPHGEENREAYTQGCDAAADGKQRRCPYKKDDRRRAYWLRGYDETQVAGADMRQCTACQTDYDGNAYDACPECRSENFVRLEAQKAD